MSSGIKILVTGGAGYVGSHACKALAAAGFVPVAFDDLSRGHLDAVRWGPFEEGNLNDRARLKDVFEHHRPAAVMHFAGLAYVGESVEEPEIYYRVNLEGSLSLLSVMREVGLKKLVFSSSCSVYGHPERTPITESQRLLPVSPYGRSKWMVELALHDYSEAYDLDYLALRYFNAAGADPDGEIGWKHDPETRVVPLILEAAMGARPKFSIFGDDYDTADGTCVRDYIHVSDLASAHVAALQALLGGRELPRALNLGGGKGYSVRELIAAVKKVTDLEVPHEVAARRPGDPATLVANTASAEKLLGWKRKHSQIGEIIATAFQWMLERSKGTPSNPV